MNPVCNPPGLKLVEFCKKCDVVLFIVLLVIYKEIGKNRC